MVKLTLSSCRVVMATMMELGLRPTPARMAMRMTSADRDTLQCAASVEAWRRAMCSQGLQVHLTESSKLICARCAAKLAAVPLLECASIALCGRVSSQGKQWI